MQEGRRERKEVSEQGKEISLRRNMDWRSCNADIWRVAGRRRSRTTTSITACRAGSPFAESDATLRDALPGWETNNRARNIAEWPVASGAAFFLWRICLRSLTLPSSAGTEHVSASCRRTQLCEREGKIKDAPGWAAMTTCTLETTFGLSELDLIEPVEAKFHSLYKHYCG